MTDWHGHNGWFLPATGALEPRKHGQCTCRNNPSWPHCSLCLDVINCGGCKWCDPDFVLDVANETDKGAPYMLHLAPEVPAFWDIHRAPPDYPCRQSGDVCAPTGPTEWVCGPFSMVRAMRKLARQVDEAGLTDIAALCPKSRAGYVESRLNEELARVAYSENPARWFQLDALKHAARGIRKWSVEP